MFSVWPIDRGSLGQAGNLLWVSSFKQWNIFNVSGRSTDGPFYEQVHETYLMCVADRPMVLFMGKYLNQWNVFYLYGRSTDDPLYGSTCFMCVADRPMIPFMGPCVSSVWPIDRWSPLWVHVFHLCGRSTDDPLYGSTCFICVADRPMVYFVCKPSQPCSMDQWDARRRWSNGPYSTKGKWEIWVQWSVDLESL